MSKAKFASYCKMTCLGGSERGECSCTHPAACELQNHPNYDAARDEAKRRMLRYFANDAEDIHPQIQAVLDKVT